MSDKIKRKTYSEFTKALQPNAQDYTGGFWTSAHINLDEELGIISPSRTSYMRYDDTTNAFKIVAMCAYDGNASYDLYAVQDETTTGHILARDASALTWSELLDLTTYVPTGGIIRFNGNLHWGTTTYLGKYDGTTQTDNYKALKVTQTTGKYMPMVVFGGKLYVGNMRYVATLDTAGTWDDDKLILPAGQRIVDMRTFNDKIEILTTGDTDEVNSHIYTWDGDAATWDENIQINDVAPQAIFPSIGILLILGSGGRIWGYAGQSAEGKQNFDVLAEIPGRVLIQNPSCLVEHEGLVNIGILPKTSNSIGIWAFGRLPLTNNIVLFQKFTPLGSYYYDAGNVDYYGVTSMLNTSDDTSGYTVENNTGDTFADSDAVGTKTWDTPANAELSDDSYSTCDVADNYKGFIGGGGIATGNTTDIESYQFVTETVVNVVANLVEAHEGVGGLNSTTAGYFLTTSAKISKLLFATEAVTELNLGIDFDAAASGVNSTTYGYWARGTAIDGIKFADDSNQNPAATLAVSRILTGGLNSTTYGYWGGGTDGAGTNYDEVDGIKFSDESAYNPAVTLADGARYQPAGVNSGTYGYWLGGFDLAASGVAASVIDGLKFADDSSRNPAAVLNPAQGLSEGFNSSTYGYVAGGSTSPGGSTATDIQGLKFSDETAYDPAAVLSIARYYNGACQSGYV